MSNEGLITVRGEKCTMQSENGRNSAHGQVPTTVGPVNLHSAWLKFIRYCAQLGHGEIENLKIQNGLPMMAEMAIKKIKFAP